MLTRVKAWYKRQTGEHWFAATMMLEFAMRNGDVLRLKDTNFIEACGESEEKNSKERRDKATGAPLSAHARLRERTQGFSLWRGHSKKSNKGDIL